MVAFVHISLCPGNRDVGGSPRCPWVTLKWISGQIDGDIARELVAQYFIKNPTQNPATSFAFFTHVIEFSFLFCFFLPFCCCPLFSAWKAK